MYFCTAKLGWGYFCSSWFMVTTAFMHKQFLDVQFKKILSLLASFSERVNHFFCCLLLLNNITITKCPNVIYIIHDSALDNIRAINMQKILKIVFILSRSKLKCHKETWHSFFTSGTYIDTKMILYRVKGITGSDRNYGSESCWSKIPRSGQHL